MVRLPLKELLPRAKSNRSASYDHSNDPWFKQRYSEAVAGRAESIKATVVLGYLKRVGFRPAKPEDFGDGGAFPEIHIAQYPLDMGRANDRKPGRKTLLVTVDENGTLRYDAIVKQGENAKKIVYSQHKDLIPKVLKDGDCGEEMDSDEKQREIEETTQRTKAALEKIVNVKLSAAQPKKVLTQSSDSKFVMYKPKQQSAAFFSGAEGRVIRVQEMPQDPMEPSKFRHKKVPKASGSPPVTVMQSPPRPVTVKDQQDWWIPPSISNSKNPKGYTIPLDKRLAADGRVLQDVPVNENIAKFGETLCVAEQKAREEVAMRSKVQKEMSMKEKEKKEKELRELAQKARSERTGTVAPAAVPMPSQRVIDDMSTDYECVRDGSIEKETKEEREGRLQREKIREERRRERKRERRLEVKDEAMGKKSKITRDRDRDISEKVALGMATTGKGGEVMYDQRLFNQEKGMDSGFATDDSYNIYDKGLFTAQPTLSTLYKPKKDADSDMYGADEQLEKIMKTDRFKPDKAFVGTSERSGPRDRPVEFENVEEADPFGLDEFMKGAMDKVGSLGAMKASAGSM